MNHCICIGRLTHEPELQMKDKADSQTYWCRFRIAVNREFSQKEEADFFTCLVFGGKARYLTSYARKGSRVAVCGRMQTRQYEKRDGTKGYAIELFVTDLQVIDYIAKEKEEIPEEGWQPSAGQVPFEGQPAALEDGWSEEDSLYGRR